MPKKFDYWIKWVMKEEESREIMEARLKKLPELLRVDQERPEDVAYGATKTEVVERCFPEEIDWLFVCLIPEKILKAMGAGVLASMHYWNELKLVVGLGGRIKIIRKAFPGMYKCYVLQLAVSGENMQRLKATLKRTMKKRKVDINMATPIVLTSPEFVWRGFTSGEIEELPKGLENLIRWMMDEEKSRQIMEKRLVGLPLLLKVESIGKKEDLPAVRTAAEARLRRNIEELKISKLEIAKKYFKEDTDKLFLCLLKKSELKSMSALRLFAYSKWREGVRQKGFKLAGRIKILRKNYPEMYRCYVVQLGLFGEPLQRLKTKIDSILKRCHGVDINKAASGIIMFPSCGGTEFSKGKINKVKIE